MTHANAQGTGETPTPRRGTPAGGSRSRTTPSPRPPQRPTVPPPERHTIVLGGVPLAYTLRVSPRAKRVSLRVSPTKGLEVVLPRGAGRSRGEALLREKAEWVRQTLDRMQRVAPPAALPPLVSGRALSFVGESLTLAIATGAPPGRFRAQRDGGTLTVTVSDLEQETIRAALVAWYRHQARGVFAERLRVCNTFGFSFGRVSVKEQKSRWGSCSRRGNLNFNWRLLLAPLPVLDYVVTHELAHLKEPNHGPGFWALVASACPRFREHRHWLKAHGHELQF